MDDIDAEHYKTLLTGTKKKIDYMLKRVDKAVDEAFYRDVLYGKAD
jgi:hypothetical protein